MPEKKYLINEIFYSVQGEGIRIGTPNIFVRFSRCNMQCKIEPGPKSPGGFDCDTEFESGKWMTKKEIIDICQSLSKKCGWIIATGGEPALQLDRELCNEFHKFGYKIAVETNGSVLLCGDLSDGKRINPPSDAEDLKRFLAEAFCVDWITVSPKVAEHVIRQLWAHEVKYVRSFEQSVPKTRCFSLNCLVSPATYDNVFNQKDVDNCVDIVLKHPQWRLSPQLHKIWKKR